MSDTRGREGGREGGRDEGGGVSGSPVTLAHIQRESCLSTKRMADHNCHSNLPPAFSFGVMAKSSFLTRAHSSSANSNSIRTDSPCVCV